MSFPTLQALYERMASVDTCEESSLVKAFNTPDTLQYSYETEKAEDLLGKAGFPKQLDGWRFKLDHVFIPCGDDYRRTGEFVRQALRHIGIDVNPAQLGLADLDQECLYRL